MGFFDKLNKAKGGYIFISHSHDDIEQVRKIRNALEQDGFEPLCFYLKCLNDDSEIEDLIKREIDAREWFVFVNSPNSRKSKWVNLEREYITKTNSKKIITVDIEDHGSVSNAISKVVHNLRVFISYSSHNIDLARRIKNKLAEKDYLVFFAPESIPAGYEYASVVTSAITEASREGCVLAIITPEFIDSAWTLRELDYAIYQEGNIVPVIVGDVELNATMQYYLSGMQLYHLSAQPTDEEIERMVHMIGERIVAK